MAVIYMKHKNHGTKVAISDEEAIADEKRGWERYEPKPREVKDPEADQRRMEREEAESMARWNAEQKAKKRA